MKHELIFRATDRKERSEEEFFDAITRAFAAEGIDIDREDMRTALENAKQYRAIVRCKDCYHYPNEYSDCPMIGWFRCEDDYCSRAERRTDG